MACARQQTSRSIAIAKRVQDGKRGDNDASRSEADRFSRLHSCGDTLLCSDCDC